MQRTDIHRPSAIVPADYEYVGQEFVPFEGSSSFAFIKAELERIQAHKARTGGHYSQHEHGGNCMVCGSVNAIYTSLFYHSKTNTYVRMGSDCTDKVYSGQDFGAKAFRKKLQDAREYVAGKQKAKALLGDYGLSQAWELYATDYQALPLKANGAPYWEETTVRDIVGKLVQYGSISQKQQDFVRNLLNKIAERPAVEAKQQQEKELAADVPTGRITLEGVILTIKDQESNFGVVTKMLVKHATGYKVWGTMPGSLAADKGDTVRFTATLEKSNDDPKFGFFSRPTKAVNLTVPAVSQDVTTATQDANSGSLEAL